LDSLTALVGTGESQIVETNAAETIGGLNSVQMAGVVK